MFLCTFKHLKLTRKSTLLYVYEHGVKFVVDLIVALRNVRYEKFLVSESWEDYTNIQKLINN